MTICDLTNDLPGLKLNLNLLVANCLGERHFDAVFGLVESEATLLKEVLDVFQLGVVVVFVFNLFFESTIQLVCTTVDVALRECSLRARHDGCLSHHALHGLGLACAHARERCGEQSL